MEMMEMLMDILEVEMMMLVEHKRDLEGLFNETWGPYILVDSLFQRPAIVKFVQFLKTFQSTDVFVSQTRPD